MFVNALSRTRLANSTSVRGASGGVTRPQVMGRWLMLGGLGKEKTSYRWCEKRSWFRSLHVLRTKKDLKTPQFS